MFKGSKEWHQLRHEEQVAYQALNSAETKEIRAIFKGQLAALERSVRIFIPEGVRDGLLKQQMAYVRHNCMKACDVREHQYDPEDEEQEELQRKQWIEANQGMSSDEIKEANDKLIAQFEAGLLNSTDLKGFQKAIKQCDTHPATNPVTEPEDGDMRHTDEGSEVFMHGKWTFVVNNSYLGNRIDETNAQVAELRRALMKLAGQVGYLIDKLVNE